MSRLFAVVLLATALLGFGIGCGVNPAALLQGSNTSPQGDTTSDTTDNGSTDNGSDADPTPSPDDQSGGDAVSDGAADGEGGGTTDPDPAPDPEPAPAPTLTEIAWTTCGDAGLSDATIDATFTFAQAALDDGMTATQAIQFVHPNCSAYCAVPVEFCDSACLTCAPAVVDAVYE